MKTFTEFFNTPLFEEQTFNIYHHGLNCCIFDIETTGLSAQHGNKIIMTACMTKSESGSKITQFLAETPFEEDRVLKATWDFWKKEKTDYLITYNGTSFDIPFFKRRLEATRLPYDLNIYDFDLYNFIKANSNLNKRINSLSQKNVESYYGLNTNRKDVITGKESVKLFSQYAVNKDPVIENIILTHNREDVFQLNNILRYVSKDAFFELLSAHNLDNVQNINRKSKDEILKENSSFTKISELETNRTLDAALVNSGAGLPSAGGELTVRPKLSGSFLTLTGRQLRAPHLQSEKNDKYSAETTDNYDIKYLNAVYFADSENDIAAEFNAKTKSYQIKIPIKTYGNSKYLDVKNILEKAKNSSNHEQKYIYSLLQESAFLINDYLIIENEGVPLHREQNFISILISSQLYEKVRNS